MLTPFVPQVLTVVEPTQATIKHANPVKRSLCQMPKSLDYRGCITFISNCLLATKRPLREGDGFLGDKKLKHRAFRLRLLIDSTEDHEVKEQAIKDYVRLIHLMNQNN